MPASQPSIPSSDRPKDEPKGPTGRNPARPRSYLLSAWLPVVVWALVIFMLSRDPHSSRHISEILRWAMGLVGIHRVRDFGVWELIAAKSAHFSVYFILSLMIYRALALGRGAWFHGRQAAWTLLIVFLYSSSDEFHQTLVHGRSGSWRDVALDTIGGAVALVVIRGVLALWGRRRDEAAHQPEQVSA